MDTAAEILVPHVLRLVDPGAVDARYLSMSHTDDFGADNAFVFPSFRLAQRYAEHFIRTGGHTYSPEPVPELEPTLQPASAHCRVCGCISTFACPDECHWAERDLCSTCTREDPPETWVVFRLPSDLSSKSVARRFCGPVPTAEMLVADDIESLRARRPWGFAIMPRMKEDEPGIVETWTKFQ